MATETVQDAWRLLQSNQIQPGRELLLRVCKGEPKNFDAQLLAAWELCRAPARTEFAQFMVNVGKFEPPSCEIYCFFAMASALKMDDNSARHSLDAFSEAVNHNPRSPHGAALMLLVALFMSDFLIRTIYGEGGSDMMVISPFQGALQLKERHKDPLATFQEGHRTAASQAAAYQKHLQSVTAAQCAEIASVLETYCLMGQALAFRDTGRTQDAKQALKKMIAVYPRAPFDTVRRALAGWSYRSHNSQDILKQLAPGFPHPESEAVRMLLAE